MFAKKFIKENDYQETTFDGACVVNSIHHKEKIK
jgi:hypothetical protein